MTGVALHTGLYPEGVVDLLTAWRGWPSARRRRMCRLLLLFFFFITPEPRVESYAKFMSIKYEPASEPLHVFVK